MRRNLQTLDKTSACVTHGEDDNNFYYYHCFTTIISDDLH